MPYGAITSHVDVAQLCLYGFWIFFFGLILHIRREDKREGYPLESERSRRAPRTPIVGFPSPPPPKRFVMPHGEPDHFAPRDEPPAGEIHGVINSFAPLVGYPLEPSGNPMRDAVGPASYAQRRDIPDLTVHGEPKIVPMRMAPGYQVAAGDPDPHGMDVVAADGVVVGTVEELWVDRAEPRILYFQVALAGGRDAGPASVMLPAGFARVRAKTRQIRVISILAEHFAFVPEIKRPDRITRLEEDKITAYYAGGQLYATPNRQEPLA